MSAMRRRLAAFLVLLGGLALVPGLLPAAQAACTQITTWSTADASFFPVPRVTRTDRSNTPVQTYVYVDSSRELNERVTYFSMSATPSLTRDQLFTNTVSVNLSSFASETAARTVFGRDVVLFRQLNPLRWGYTVFVDEGSVLSYYADTPGAKLFEYVAVYQNTVIHLTLRSASQTESINVGMVEMGNRAIAARALVDGKCGTTPTNAVPVIGLSPPRDAGEPLSEAFQHVMAAGSIWFSVRDDDGLAEIDWNTFRLSVAGIDKTEHALQVLARLGAEGRVTAANSSDGRSVTYQLRLDPQRLMSDHNLFNIVWNGNWRIGMRICDRRGACGSSEDTLAFGPYLLVTSWIDMRCYGTAGATVFEVDAHWGNNGHQALTNFYIALGRPESDWQTWTSGYHTLSMGLLPPFDALQWFGATWGPKPLLGGGSVPLAGGTAHEHQPLSLPIRSWTSGSAQELLPAGRYTLAYGAIDLTQTVLAVTDRQVTICSGRTAAGGASAR